MTEIPCNTCTLQTKCGQFRTLGKQGDKYICGDYVPINKTFGIACQNCFNAEAEMQGDDGVYLCSDCYHMEPPVRCCANCENDGKQLVERKCIECGERYQYANFEAKT